MERSFNDVSLILRTQMNSYSFDDKITISDNLSAYTLPCFSEMKGKIKTTRLKYSAIVQALVCIEGTIEIEVDFKRFHLAKNDIIIITNKQVGELYEMSDDVQYALVLINADFYDPNLNRTNTINQRKLLADFPFCHVNDKELKEIVVTYELLKAKMQQEDTYYRTETIKGYVHAFFYNIFSKLTERKKEQEKAVVQDILEISRQQDIYKRFMHTVEKNYVHERHIKFYADILCITPKYLSQIIYKVSGRFANEFINDYVIREAKALIKSHNYTMLQISEMLNFTSQSFFSRFFKKATGYTPLQYQNEN
ncbi:MAG: AraC family transcriptional regulator [Tannerellaceae bacterium]|jgi:AraC-like DNA-binding protein|nr:AraC family transcriptional regulator [Tannerellaceae bacterium]